ncbi:MAG: hypothetical protein AAF697_12220 [Pseudomonadota bacterium]
MPMTARLAILAAGAMALTACGSDPEELEVSDSSEPAPAQEVGVSGGTIPDRFHGVWDYVEGTCAPESDLRIEVSASQINFYESAGTVVTALPVGDTVIVDLEMSGEGETWTQKSSLINAPGSDRLVFEPDAANPVADPANERKRCS